MPNPDLKLATERRRKPTHKITFTRDAIEAIDPPAKPPSGKGAKRWVYDHRQPGLALAITDHGHRAFYLYRKSNGRPVRLKIGNYDELSIDQARRRAAELSGDIARGEDVAATRRLKRRGLADIPTFKAVYEHYRDLHLKAHCSPKTIQNDKYLFKAVTFRGRKLDTITTDDVRRLHVKLAARGEVWANRVVQFIRRVFNYANDELGYRGDNPVRVRKGRRRRGNRTGGNGASVHLARERSRERYLKPEEAPRFFKALKAEKDDDLKDLVHLLLYTGARRSNVQAMKWAHVDLSGGTWTIPADETKEGAAIHIPLSRHAVNVLKRRRESAADDAVFVFPSKRSASGHMMEPKKRWWELRKRAGVPDLTLHDLRRTLGTWQRTAGANLETIGASLGHASIAATEVYARADLEPVRRSVDAATDALLKAGAAKPKRARASKGGA